MQSVTRTMLGIRIITYYADNNKSLARLNRVLYPEAIIKFLLTKVVMNEYIVAIILGLVQGITEFLPISSSGHLIIASTLLGVTESKAAVFNIVIQFGSILAVVVLYRQRFLGLLRSKDNVLFSGYYGLYMLFLTSLPACVVGFFLRNYIKKSLFNPLSVSIALAVGAFFILFVEKYKPSAKFISLDELTPKTALGVGFFQCLSLWPGFSRSASTIMGGLIMGANRSLAAEYSFIAAVPIMFAATGYEALHSAELLTNDISFFLVGTFVAFISAMAAIKIFIALIARISFKPFAWYRLVIAPFVYYFFM